MSDEMAGGGGDSLGSGGEVGSSPSPAPETTSGDSPSRPEHLLEGYADDTAQAQAYHKFHQQYGGQHEHYAQQGNWFAQRYYNDPVFKQWVDDYNAGKHQQQAQQPPAQAKPAPYDVNNPETLDKFWNEGIANPDKIFEIAEERAYARVQKELAPQLAQLKAMQQQSEARRIFQQHGATLQEMQKSPYGQQLINWSTQRGIPIEEAIQAYQAAKQQQNPQAESPAPAAAVARAQQAVRDPQGKFQRVSGNGRRSGVNQTGKALTTSEILAEAKAKRF